MALTLLKPHYYTLRNRYRGSEDEGNYGKRDFMLLGIALLVMGCIFAGFVMILKTTGSNPILAEILPAKIVELLFYTFFVLLLISNSVAHTGNIYNAENMDLFLRAPQSNVRLFFAKLIESVFETCTMFVVFGLPVALAFICVLDIPLYGLLVAGVVSIPFLLIPSALAMIFATAFARMAASIWQRGLFLLVVGIGVFAWALSQLIVRLGNVDSAEHGKAALVSMIGLFDNPSPVWLPSRWIADILNYFVLGEVSSPLAKCSLLLCTAVGSCALAYTVFDFFMLSVRSAAGVHRGTAKEAAESAADKDPVRALLELVYLHLPIDTQIRAIILKDLTTLVRDRAQSLQLLLYLGISMVYLVITEFTSMSLNLAPTAQQVWWGFLACVNVIFAGFIVSGVMTRLVFPSISLEGRSFWILRTGPLPLDALIRAKFWCWFPLSLTVALGLMLAGSYAIYPSLSLLLWSSYIAFSLSIGCTGLAVGVGAVFASFEWESPYQISSGFGTLVLLLSSLLIVGITFIPASALTFLTVVPAARAKLGDSVWPGVMVVSAAMVFLLNYFTAKIAFAKGTAALKKVN